LNELLDNRDDVLKRPTRRRGSIGLCLERLRRLQEEGVLMTGYVVIKSFDVVVKSFKNHKSEVVHGCYRLRR
jgi:hypothetical protein